MQNFDLGPVIHLLVMGALVAMVPLCWVWLRNPRASTSRRVQLLTLVTLFLTFDLVLFGAFTRLTDSGLGCPDWPGCYGYASPVGAQASIAVEQSQMPSGPVTHTKAWIEMVHRYMAMAVGGLILTLASFAWVRRWRGFGGGCNNVAWPTFTLVWVCVQGAFGALTVTMRLFPLIVTLHLLCALVLLALLTLQVQRDRLQTGSAVALNLSSRLFMATLVGLGLLTAQVLLGGWVSTNYAVLACNSFPQCQGSWWPLMDFEQGFTLWRHLGLNAQGEPLTFEALTAIHYVHRLAAYLVLVYLTWLALRLRRVAESPAKLLLGLLFLQLLTGLSNVVLDWPLVAAVLHTGGAAAMVVVLVWLLTGARASRTALN